MEISDADDRRLYAFQMWCWSCERWMHEQAAHTSERNYTVKTIWRDMLSESMEVAKIFTGFGTLSCDQNGWQHFFTSFNCNLSYFGNDKTIIQYLL